MIDTRMTTAPFTDRRDVGQPSGSCRKPAHGDRRAFWRDVLATDVFNPPRHERTWHRQRIVTVALAVVLAAVWQAIGG